MLAVDATDPEFVPNVPTTFEEVELLDGDPVADPNIELIPGSPLEIHQGTLFATVLVNVVGVVDSGTLLVNDDDPTVLLIEMDPASEEVVGLETVLWLETELEFVKKPELVSPSEVEFEKTPALIS